MSSLVSRVHAMLVRVDGALHLIDAGSTNGTSTAGRDVKCEPVLAGQIYELGKMFVRWEPSH